MEMTALEKRWAEEAVEKAAAEAAAAEAAAVEEAEEEQRIENIKDHLPQPTGWRVVVLPYRGAKKTKTGYSARAGKT